MRLVCWHRGNVLALDLAYWHLVAVSEGMEQMSCGTSEVALVHQKWGTLAPTISLSGWSACRLAVAPPGALNPTFTGKSASTGCSSHKRHGDLDNRNNSDVE